MAEILAAQQKAKFGSVKEISAVDYVDEVNKAGEGVWVVLHLYKPGYPLVCYRFVVVNLLLCCCHFIVVLLSIYCCVVVNLFLCCCHFIVVLLSFHCCVVNLLCCCHFIVVLLSFYCCVVVTVTVNPVHLFLKLQYCMHDIICVAQAYLL